ncbi:hypothetical protein [Adhaeribacter aquaticus]|uniref:hypothetical protein n=1 Tax=Adhaeribacter aquaticus TaxID=299567 RepID=UPI0003F52426|nr:hypothetical protein [Adhaeribacter aquaticus]
MEATITIRVSLEGKICTTASGHNRLIQFYNNCKQYFDCIIYIDFSNLYWFDANLSAVLQAILYKLNKDNCLSFNFDVNLVRNKFPILFRNGFLSSILSLQDNLGSTVEMELFDCSEDVKFYNYIKEQLLGHSQMGNLNCTGVEENFLEVFANISKHAKTLDPVFACGQFYPNESKLAFSLVDLGIGFLPPIKAFTNGKIASSEQAIKWAVEYSNTTKERDETGGIGLHNVLTHCKETGGHFNIVTGDAYWGNNLGEMGTRRISEFVGTTIHLIYNCK